MAVVAGRAGAVAEVGAVTGPAAAAAVVGIAALTELDEDRRPRGEALYRLLRLSPLLDDEDGGLRSCSAP